MSLHQMSEVKKKKKQKKKRGECVMVRWWCVGEWVVGTRMLVLSEKKKRMMMMKWMMKMRMKTLCLMVIDSKVIEWVDGEQQVNVSLWETLFVLC